MLITNDERCAILRCAIIALFMLSPLHLIAQSLTGETCFRDCYGAVARVKGDSVNYYSLKKRTYKLKLNEVAFEGGLDALRETIYAHLKYEHEENIRIIVFILFDRKLHIDEVRLCELVPNHVHISSHRMSCGYYKDYLRSIRKTKNKWKTKEKGRQVAMFGIHVR